LGTAISQYLTFLWGPVAQLIERFVRNEEVVGLIPIRSTNPFPVPSAGDSNRWKGVFSEWWFFAALQLTGAECTYQLWQSDKDFTALSLEVWPPFCYLGR